MKIHKAIALFSGGLDSILAVKWMQSRGYTVYPVFFRAPYLKAERALHYAEQNEIELEVVDVSSEHLQLLYKPVYGFGKWLNPCIDCHGFMFRKAAEMLATKQADFLISGEVLGQRPMSQRRDALDSVGRLSGVKDLLIRPLSQLHLSDTKPIREGWVDKEDMLDFHGRGRYAQLNLAKQLDVTSFPAPAGGCLLTDRNYCLRLQDLIERKQETLENLELLAYGRHFRLSDSLKLIIGRDEADNNALESLFHNGYRLLAKGIFGPLGLLIGDEPDDHLLQIGLQIFLHYHPKAEQQDVVTVQHYENAQPVNMAHEYKTVKADVELAKQYRLSYD
ncbi:MAG: tRNA (5-methylaminomethyl-2-thiouridylate)-methyltransferase [Candidatus Cloacimonas sp.]|jgi:tRNA U34 2-thiouridine synthase MnmA/TrmU|nr:tRNA (5-methylaminomethyl-2-thiouridylate)-methyltransferase [Candidatus Cloacimonas sp.]